MNTLELAMTERHLDERIEARESVVIHEPLHRRHVVYDLTCILRRDKDGFARLFVPECSARSFTKPVYYDPDLMSPTPPRRSRKAPSARLRELLAEEQRVLVFSKFVEMLRLIEADLAEAGISHLESTAKCGA